MKLSEISAVFGRMLCRGFSGWCVSNAGLGLVAVASMLLVVASCGGGGDVADDEEAGDGDADDVVDVGVSGGEEVAGGVDADDGLGEFGVLVDELLVDYIGVSVSGFDLEGQQAFHMRLEQVVQDLTAECMALRDFEYMPAVQPHSNSVGGVVSVEEVVREQGLGITTRFGVTDSDALEGVADDGWRNPNEAIVEALSEAGKQAYYDALYGVDEVASGTEDTEGGVAAVASDVGCLDQSYDEIDSFLNAVGQLDLGSLFHEIRDDPQTQAVFEDWSLCMRAEGYEYEDPDEMYGGVYDDLMPQLEEIMGVSESGDLLVDTPPEEIDQDALAELQAEERKVAVADFECSEEVELDERLGSISSRHEEQFMSESALLDGSKR